MDCHEFGRKKEHVPHPKAQDEHFCGGKHQPDHPHIGTQIALVHGYLVHFGLL